MRSLALTVLLLWASTARAGDLAAAKEHYQRGTTLYDLQRFAEAAREYEAAFEQRDEPALLFNIGQAYRFAGETQKALGAFRAYLRRLPQADNRAEVEVKINELQHKKGRETPPPPPPPEAVPDEPKIKPGVEPPPVAATPPSVQPTGRTKRIAGLTLGGVGIAGLAVGIVFEVLASNANYDLSHPAPGTHFNQSMQNRITNDQAVEAAFFAVGGAALVTGAVLYIVGARQDKHAHISFIPSLAPGAVAGRLQLQF